MEGGGNQADGQMVAASESVESIEEGGQTTGAEVVSDSAVPATQQRRLTEKRDRQRREREADAREASAREAAETVAIDVFRYDPDVERKREPFFQRFSVPYSKGMTVLDALLYARDHHDPTLTLRYSCRQASCGSDAVFINGRQRLACRTQIADLELPVRVEPLPHQAVIKDLVVDMDHFYDQMHAVEPYFQPDELPEGREQRQSPENHEQIKMATRCIWCGACMSSCNIAAGDDQYLGPASIVKGYRFYMDEREGERAQAHRLDLLDKQQGVWRCQTQFSCTNVCPKDIPITEEIQAMKREAVKKGQKFW